MLDFKIKFRFTASQACLRQPQESPLIETHALAALGVADDGDTKKISQYAAADKTGDELFAEYFSMWRAGQPLPDYIKNFINEAVK